MTVKSLIENLQPLPQGVKVRMTCNNCNTVGDEIQRVEFVPARGALEFLQPPVVFLWGEA